MKVVYKDTLPNGIMIIADMAGCVYNQIQIYIYGYL